MASLSSEKAGTQLKVGPPGGFHLTDRCSEGNNPGPPWVAGRGLAHSDLLECREPQRSSLTSKCPACCQHPSRSFCLENFPLGQGRSVGGKRSFWSVVQIGKWQEAGQSREEWRSPIQVPWPLPLSSLPARPLHPPVPASQPCPSDVTIWSGLPLLSQSRCPLRAHRGPGPIPGFHSFLRLRSPPSCLKLYLEGPRWVREWDQIS